MNAPIAKLNTLSASKPGRLEIVAVTDAKLFAEKRQELLNSGWVVRENGIDSWLDHREIADFSKSGSEMYTWNKSGTRTKHNNVLVTVDKNGERDEKIIGTSFRGESNG